MQRISPPELNSVLTQGHSGVQGSLVSAADVRLYGNLDNATSTGSANTMDFVSVLSAPYPE